jgi:post-segregation antitoxin (ccd killing protein)
MSLLNVRVDRQLLAKARQLRKDGVKISELVRQTIESAYARRPRKQKPQDVKAAIEAIYSKYPDPLDKKPRGFDLRDRVAVREHIGKRIRSKKR